MDANKKLVKTKWGPFDLRTVDGVHFTAHSHTGSGYYDAPEPIVINGVALHVSLAVASCPESCCKSEFAGYPGPGIGGYRNTLLYVSRYGASGEPSIAAKKTLRTTIAAEIIRAISPEFVATGKAILKVATIADLEHKIGEHEAALATLKPKLAALLAEK